VTRTYLTKQSVLFIHRRQIEIFGGSDGLRDEAGLESALIRPQTGYYVDVIAEAAALWESLSQNHPFIDGNKRTAFSSVDIFLGLNGLEITVSVDESIDFILGLYEGREFRFEKLEPWLRAHTATR